VSLDLTAIADSVVKPDAEMADLARAHLDALAKPIGALGRLEELAIWLCSVQGQCPPRPLDRARIVIFAGDHGVATTGVSAYPPQVTPVMVRTFVAQSAAINALAATVGAQVRVLDIGVDADLTDLPADVTSHKVTRGSGDISTQDALSAEDAERAFAAGLAIADEEVDAGADVLLTGDMGIGNTTPAAALIGLLTGNDPAAVTGRGTGVDDDAWMRKCAAIRDAMYRGRSHLGEPLDLLAAIGSADLAAMTGFLVQAAARRTPVILDGVVSGASALVAQRVAHRAANWWIAGHRSVEPAHDMALKRLALTPLLDLHLRLGEGTGAALALPLLRAAQAASAQMATLADLGFTAPTTVDPHDTVDSAPDSPYTDTDDMDADDMDAGSANG
jgi:nicotinate-nucleotide--dimethylbenzimidazole phosphoribosyltransferase